MHSYIIMYCLIIPTSYTMFIHYILTLYFSVCLVSHSQSSGRTSLALVKTSYCHKAINYGCFQKQQPMTDNYTFTFNI